jgi:hypothetical protein
VKKHRFIKFDISLYKMVLFAILLCIDLANGGGTGAAITIAAFVLGISNIVILG